MGWSALPIISIQAIWIALLSMCFFEPMGRSVPGKVDLRPVGLPPGASAGDHQVDVPMLKYCRRFP